MNLSDEELAFLRLRVKPRGRPLKYKIDHLEPWDVYEIPADLEGSRLLVAVNSITAAGKRRGWTMARVGTHRMVRLGAPSTLPAASKERF